MSRHVNCVTYLITRTYARRAQTMLALATHVRSIRIYVRSSIIIFIYIVHVALPNHVPHVFLHATKVESRVEWLHQLQLLQAHLILKVSTVHKIVKKQKENNRIQV